MIFRKCQSSTLFKEAKIDSKAFSVIIEEELQWFIEQLGMINPAISQNRTLKENCFCISICILNKIPLFITGEPGTSKTLSFMIVMNQLKGKTSSSDLF